mmetsp:Transcript_25896/g.51057  ORF Transcript_25896/g.51057 Transcript_25896/m.51057 type:complete len:96 (+) Transcript_25896:306-593(+)
MHSSALGRLSLISCWYQQFTTWKCCKHAPISIDLLMKLMNFGGTFIAFIAFIKVIRNRRKVSQVECSYLLLQLWFELERFASTINRYSRSRTGSC